MVGTAPLRLACAGGGTRFFTSCAYSQWTWQKHEFNWGAVQTDWKPPTLPDGTEWDPEHEDSRHYLNGFVGKGEDCEYLNPGTNEWAKKHIAAQKRLEAKSSERSSSKSAGSSSRG